MRITLYKLTYKGEMVMKNTYSGFSQEELEEIQAIIGLIGEDVPYEDALAAYNEIIDRGSLY